MTRWLWERNPEGTARFTLATLGSNPLVCVGINPNTAVPDDLDRTVNRVTGFASSNGFDSWTMLNVYPQIATDPDNILRTPGFVVWSLLSGASPRDDLV